MQLNKAMFLLNFDYIEMSYTVEGKKHTSYQVVLIEL